MTAHTPGPWHRNIPPATKYVVVWSGRNKHVARVYCEGLSDEEVEANINLIAAAPQLLAALKEVDSLTDSLFYSTTFEAIRKTVGDAIARAEPQSASAGDLAANTFEVGKPAPYYCPACEAVPATGYCKLSGCPTALSDNA